jgi:hypothetical protein
MALSYTVISNLGLNSLSKLSEAKRPNYRKDSKDQSLGSKTKTSNQLRRITTGPGYTRCDDDQTHFYPTGQEL